MSDQLDETGEPLEEIRQRLINIELKINAIGPSPEAGSSSYSGHSDQVFGHKTYAQHGDDLVALNIFHNIGITRPSYLDIGAHHPLNISNTALLYELGCRGVNVEPNPHLFANFLEMRPEDQNLNIGVSFKEGMLDFYMIDDFSGRNTFDRQTALEFVADHPAFTIQSIKPIEVWSLETLIEKIGGTFPDFLSIDVEGLDLPILKSYDFNKTRPKVICAEYISGGSSNVHLEIKETLNSCGYFLYFKTVGNAFYVHEDFKELLD